MRREACGDEKAGQEHGDRDDQLDDLGDEKEVVLRDDPPPGLFVDEVVELLHHIDHDEHEEDRDKGEDRGGEELADDGPVEEFHEDGGSPFAVVSSRARHLRGTNRVRIDQWITTVSLATRTVR